MDRKRYKYLLDRFFDGETTPEENELLHSVLGEGMDTRFEEYSKDKWDANHYAMPEFRKEMMKADILRRIHAEEDYRRHGRMKLLKTAAAGLAVAASIAVAAIAGYRFHDMSQPVQEFEVVAERGQKSMVTLPDGTKVWLNSGSRLAYTSAYNSKNREIFLNGEAYFDVAKNRELPFDVNAGGMTVRALGTKFNVKAFPEDGKVAATLVEGCISATSGDASIVLQPWQQAVLDSRTGKMLKTEVVNRNNPVPWRQNEILFEGENLRQVGAMLERMYNVKVLIADDIADYSYTGLISNNSLTNVLELISGTSPVRYTMHGNVIKFNATK
ncbi:MAG: FecR domain-containing protein [Bacteroides sp.]|nr:FecR domain-containing protein [Bacteroides sp.]